MVNAKKKGRQIGDALVRWFRRNARRLPWRHDAEENHPDPYAVVVSELMLQQTRVETVLRYYTPFLERFPDTATLSEAGDEALRRAWQGLGYYRRARYLRGAAQAVMAEHDGVWPTTHEGLLTLPGFGPYTAGAVGAIAYGIKSVVADGNVLRVSGRLHGVPNRDKPKLQSEEDVVFLSSLGSAHPGTVVQAWMELGALVCTPQAPQCLICPLRKCCLAAETGDASSFGSPKPKRAPKQQEMLLLVLEVEQKVALLLRPHGLLEGQWGLPTIILEESVAEAEVKQQVQSMFGATPTKLGMYRHQFTHRHWHCQVWQIALRSDEVLDLGNDQMRWVKTASLYDVPVPSAYRSAVNLALQYFDQT